MSIFRIISSTILAAIITACGHTDDMNTYTIRGTLPSTEYDGEWMYLVPIKNDKGRVDSVKIKDGAFIFKGDSAEMKVLRMHYLLRDRLQELLVATEPGVITVVIDSISTGGGTPQNDALQRWKNSLSDYGQQLSILNEQYRDATPSDMEAIKQTADSLSAAQISRCFDIALDMKGTVFGDFLYENYHNVFSDSQNAQLEDKIATSPDEQQAQ